MQKIIILALTLIALNRCSAENSITLNNKVKIQWVYNDDSTSFNVSSSLASGIDPGIV